MQNENATPATATEKLSSALQQQLISQTTSREFIYEWPSIDHYKETSAEGTKKKIFTGPWHVEEKVDGSQLSFRVSNESDEIVFRNRNRFMSSKNPPKDGVFTNAILAITLIKHNLNPQFIYRGEAVCKQKHNNLEYQRTPKKFFVLFDVEDAVNVSFLNYGEKVKEALRLGFEVSPKLFESSNPGDEAELPKIIEKMDNGEIKSFLGGIPEGIVVKNYSRTRSTNVPLLLKLVRDEYKESAQMKKEVSKVVTLDELCERLGRQYAVIPRFRKSVQHLEEQGDGLTSTNNDINLLVQELDADLLKEYRDDIASALLGFCLPKITNASREGFVEWYKELLKAKESTNKN